MSSALLITARLHDNRYHGAGEWPPSPARLFQALVAGVGLGGPLGQRERDALTWLEEREPPLIGAPAMRDGCTFRTYVPNNDLDSVGGDLRRVGAIRTDKLVKPRLIDDGVPFLYAWISEGVGEDESQAQATCDLAERLYQFGRGVDMAWAWGELLGDEEVEARLASYPGRIYRPSGGGNGTTLACPKAGSLESLEERYAASTKRFKTVGRGSTKQLFSQPPKPRFAPVAYESPPSRRVYELRERSPEPSFAVWPPARAARLVVLVRDGAVERLRRALTARSADIERVMVGRKPDGTDEGPTSSRVKIVPLPSIGHHHADRGIRRVLVEVPAECLLSAQDVHWACSALEPLDTETGEVLDLILTPAADENMLTHYGVGEDACSRVWRTVTPAALSGATRQRQDRHERVARQTRAATAVTQALRHAGVRERAELIRVQREPFEANGERAEEFASGTRFAKERLWHVEITFDAPLAGPLVIGDGRFLGLGVMAPVRRSKGVHAFVIEGGLAATPHPTEVARALRRAVMARVQELLGATVTLPTFFSGHERDGSPARMERSSHLTFLFDPGSLEPARLLIVAPHIVERRDPTREEARHLQDLDAAMAAFRELRAGSSGRLALRAGVIDTDQDPLFSPSRTWESVTPYHVTRHAKRIGASDALAADLHAECRRCGLPEPRVSPRYPRGVPGVGLLGLARLTFEVAVGGPIVLGRSRHLGGGLFGGTPSSSRRRE